jgi:redox-sensing transcriptional repressor
MSSVKSFPVPSIQRLPIYLRFLKRLQRSGVMLISCTQISEQLGQLSVQVRKDLAITGITGRPKIGYHVDELIEAIEAFLGWDKTINAFLVGVGSLGSAILGYDGFVEHGLRIVAAFDVDPQKVGQTIRHCPVYDLDELVERSRNQRIELGILTVPSSSAQEVAQLLIQTGVRGIWNYTPVRLEIPPDIVCESVKLSASFAVLTKRLSKNDLQL